MSDASTDARPSAKFQKNLVAAMPFLKGRAYNLCKDRDRAEDLVQSTLERALRYHDKYEDTGTPITAWLATIMKNHFLGQIRKKSEAEDPEGFLEGGLVARENQEESFSASQGLAAFETLPADQREAIREIANGASYEEVAEKFGVEVGTIKSRVSRGRKLLGIKMSDQLDVQVEIDIETRHVTSLDVRFNPRDDVGEELPQLVTVFPSDLIVEAAYQRELSPKSIKLIQKIVDEWDWTKFKPPVCAKTADGLFVIDGQHTAIAAASHPHVIAIPALIVSADKLEKRAAAFVSHNRDRLAMTPAQIFYGDLAARDPVARKVMEAVVSAGASIPRLPVARGAWKVGQIAAIGELRDAIGSVGAEGLQRVLRICVQAHLAPITKTSMRALRSIFTEKAYSQFAKAHDDLLVHAIKNIPDIEKTSSERAALDGISRFKACANLIVGGLK